MIRLSMLFLSLFLGSVAVAQDYPALYRVADVAAHDVLNIRSEPSARSAIIGSYAPGESGIEVIALTADGRWAMVNTGERQGWAAARYLAAMTTESWLEGNQPLSCFGTEPFWHLQAFLPGHQAEFHTPDNGGVNLVTEAGALPGTRFPPTLAIPFSGALRGFAVLRSDACSDGMSDRSYGIGVQVYFFGQREGLSGCCSVTR